MMRARSKGSAWCARIERTATKTRIARAATAKTFLDGLRKGRVKARKVVLESIVHLVRWEDAGAGRGVGSGCFGDALMRIPTTNFLYLVRGDRPRRPKTALHCRAVQNGDRFRSGRWQSSRCNLNDVVSHRVENQFADRMQT